MGYTNAMTLVPLKLILIIATVLLGTFFAIGLLHWHAHPYKCFDGKHYYGDWVVVWSVGPLEIRSKAYGCVSSDQYDPKQFQSLNGPSPLPHM